MTFVSICVTKWKPIAKILQVKFYVSCISTSIFIAFHLDKDELASDLPLMADCKLIIEPLKEANKNVITRLFYVKVKNIHRMYSTYNVQMAMFHKST